MHSIIREKMIDSGYSELVGGGDPFENGNINLGIINKYSQINENSSILDFGCGCGRLALPLLEQMANNGRYVGVDIIPDLVNFCRIEIASVYSNSEFYQLEATNSHYSEWLKKSSPIEGHLSKLSDLGGEQFHLIVAFSVFTHLSSSELAKYFHALTELLHPGGTLLVSVFLVNSVTKKSTEDGNSAISFIRPTWRKRKEYFADKDSEMAAVGFPEKTVIDSAAQAGLSPTNIYYGSWSGQASSSSFQDIVVLKKTARLPRNFSPGTYLSLHPDLPWDPLTKDGLDSAKLHYLNFGFYEGRRWRQ